MKVISGGQTGAGRAALDPALADITRSRALVRKGAWQRKGRYQSATRLRKSLVAIEPELGKMFRQATVRSLSIATSSRAAQH